MPAPSIKLMAVSNVFSRIMHFQNAGDVEIGHKHTYDHATLVSSGSVCVEILNDGVPESSRTFTAPDMVFIQKDKIHRLTALQDNTVCACIHALRTVDDELVDPEFLLQPMQGGGGAILNAVKDHCGQPMQPFVA